MKSSLILISFLGLLSSNLLAGSHSYQKSKIREIREWLEESVNPDSSCVDEYFKRRKQLGIKIGLSPVIIAGSTAVGFTGGAFAGIGLFKLSGVPIVGFNDLAALAAGALLGGTSGLGIGGGNSTLAVVNFFRNQNLLRLFYDSNHEGGEAVEKFYSEFKSLYPKSLLSKEGFMREIVTIDITGKLCDGSLVGPRRFKTGKKLKQRLATKSEIYLYLSKR